MPFVVVGLVILVLWFASRSPDPNASMTQQLGPDLSVPPLGATDAPSPATSNGAPGAARQFQTKLFTNAGLVGRSSRMSSRVISQLQAPRGTFTPPTADMDATGHSLVNPPSANPVRDTLNGGGPGTIKL